MPSTSQKQHNLMAMVASDPAAAKRVGIPQSVGKEYLSADKGKKFGADTRADSQVANKPKTNHGEKALFKRGGEMKMKKMGMGGDTTGMGPNKQSKGITKEKMGAVRTAAPSRDGLAAKGKTKGMMPKMAGNAIGTGKATLTHGTYKRGGMAKKK
jgi:hypothetical protein